ncbi:glucokinase [Undibacterium sp. JH2W]|uniref:glucokinase n=1 Tax=Undibacterium sp. JH2W TaxID=3413037 RepID=UPI003BF0A7DE
MLTSFMYRSGSGIENMNGEMLSNNPKKSDGMSPRLLADIGGTNARFALEVASHEFVAIAVLACNAYPDLQSAVAAYLSSPEVLAACSSAVKNAAIAIANPVDGDVVRMTNHHWTFSIEALRLAAGFDHLVVVNDFTALAMALPHLAANERVQIGGGQPQANRAIGLIGPGTGLGVSGIIPSGSHWLPLSSEGGHVSFSPSDETEIAILRQVWTEYPHASAERLISGMGLELMYRILAQIDHQSGMAEMNAADITGRALDGSCAICSRTVSYFCAMLGTVAGNLAMTLGATGGVYIGGGIVPRLGDFFVQSAFRQRFEAKGRFADYLAQIPTYLITAEYPAFLGVSAILNERLALSDIAGIADI